MDIDASRLRAEIAGLRGRFEDELAALVEIPTVSMDPARRPQMDACVALASDYLRGAGARVDVIDTGGFPLVVGRIERDPSFPTVTIYNHLDVQPADGPDWKTPPFTFSRAGDR
jgi:acetylornithine deacetylase/succinyl-diaminopimelate desuccinylase-like protein